MFRFKKYNKIVLIVGLTFILLGCSTEKNVALNRGFHNMSARYNGYFNAGEIIKESLNSFEEGYKDDYSKLLTVQLYPNQEAAINFFPMMDTAIGKCSKVIHRHSMPDPNVVSNKKEENCRWIDDNWLLIGKAHFVKREFDEAEEKFRYVSNEYTGESSRYEAGIWLSKIYIEKGDYTKAKLELLKVKGLKEKAEAEQKKIMDIFKKDKSKKKKQSKYKRKKAKKSKKKNEVAKFSRGMVLKYELAMADLGIHQENNKSAAEHLEKAIEVCRNRKEKARYHFILGQLYSEMGDGPLAEKHFQKVVKSSASYELRFYAKIKRALSSTGGGEELRKDLKKMLKDAKNEEYKDQIYYVLAEMDLKEGNRDGAIENLNNSVLSSVNNDLQKAMSYLKLADLHFESKEYIDAQKYYDNCVKVLPQSHEKYTFIESKAKSLSSLVENYEVYVLQDSLQKIAALPEKAREKELKKILKQIEDERKQKEIDDRLKLLVQQSRVTNSSTSAKGGSKWYFYNQKVRANGINDFKSFWSDRVLEDDWRRSSKQQLLSFTDDSDTTTSEEITVEDSLTVDLLRDGLPLTNEDLMISNDKLLSALYNLGMIYKNQLKEDNDAIAYFAKVVDKNVEHEKVLPAAYQLNLLYTKQNPSKAKRYEDYILNNFPESDIAKLLADPSYFEKKEKMERRDLEAYKAVLDDYKYRRYIKVISGCNKVLFAKEKNKFINKYYLLKANAISKSGIGGVEAVKAPLIALYELSPDSEEGIVAKKYLDGLIAPEKEKEDRNTVKFHVNKNEKHVFVVVVPNSKNVSVNDLKVDVSNFTSSYFSAENLKISTSMINPENQILLVKTLADFEKAKIYQDAFESEPAKSLLKNAADDFECFAISKSNLSVLFSSKDISGYIEFVKENL